MYKHIAAHHTIDLIYWTGDLPPHDIWKQSRHGNVEVNLIILLAPYFQHGISMFKGYDEIYAGGAKNSETVEGIFPRSGGLASSWKSRVGSC